MSSQQIAAKLKFDIEEAKLKNSRRIKEAATLFTNTQEDVRLDQARTKLKLGKSLEDISAQIQKDREAGKNQPVQASGVAPPRNIPSSANGGGGGAGAVGELASAILGGDKNIQSSPQTATGPGPRPGTLTDTVTHEAPRNLSVRGIPFGQILGGLIQGAGNLVGSEGTANFGRAITTQKFETKSTREDPDFEQLKDDSVTRAAVVMHGLNAGTHKPEDLFRVMNQTISAVGPANVKQIVQRSVVAAQQIEQTKIGQAGELATTMAKEFTNQDIDMSNPTTRGVMSRAIKANINQDVSAILQSGAEIQAVSKNSYDSKTREQNLRSNEVAMENTRQATLTSRQQASASRSNQRSVEQTTKFAAEDRLINKEIDVARLRNLNVTADLASERLSVAIQTRQDQVDQIRANVASTQVNTARQRLGIDIDKFGFTTDKFMQGFRIQREMTQAERERYGLEGDKLGLAIAKEGWENTKLNRDLMRDLLIADLGNTRARTEATEVGTEGARTSNRITERTEEDVVKQVGLRTDELEINRMLNVFRSLEEQETAPLRKKLLELGVTDGELAIAERRRKTSELVRNGTLLDRQLQASVEGQEINNLSHVFALNESIEKQPGIMKALELSNEHMRLSTIQLSNDINTQGIKADLITQQIQQKGFFKGLGFTGAPPISQLDALKEWRAITKNGSLINGDNRAQVAIIQKNQIEAGNPFPVLVDSWTGNSTAMIDPREVVNDLMTLGSPTRSGSPDEQSEAAARLQKRGFTLQRPEPGGSEWNYGGPTADNKSSEALWMLVRLAQGLEGMERKVASEGNGSVKIDPWDFQAQSSGPPGFRATQPPARPEAPPHASLPAQPRHIEAANIGGTFGAKLDKAIGFAIVQATRGAAGLGGTIMKQPGQEGLLNLVTGGLGAAGLLPTKPTGPTNGQNPNP